MVTAVLSDVVHPPLFQRGMHTGGVQDGVVDHRELVVGSAKQC